jgi:hypothetical protein
MMKCAVRDQHADESLGAQAQAPVRLGYWQRVGLSQLVMVAMLLPGVAVDTSSEAANTLAQTFEKDIKPFLQTYCLDCHGGKKTKGDLDLARFTSGKLALGFEDIWKDGAGRVHNQDMPPEKAERQPSLAERQRFITWVGNLKYLHPKDPGRGTIRRLSQVEYANTVHDLLGVDKSVANSLPQDAVGAGFNSSISPLLMEKYLAVAGDMLDDIIKPDRLSVLWPAGQLSVIVNNKETPGKPQGTDRTIVGPGEIAVLLSAPVEGNYTIRVRGAAEKVNSKEPARVAVRIDGQVVKEIKITAQPKTPGTYSLTCKLPAGKARLSFLMVNP